MRDFEMNNTVPSTFARNNHSTSNLDGIDSLFLEHRRMDLKLVRNYLELDHDNVRTKYYFFHGNASSNTDDLQKQRIFCREMLSHKSYSQNIPYEIPRRMQQRWAHQFFESISNNLMKSSVQNLLDKTPCYCAQREVRVSYVCRWYTKFRYTILSNASHDMSFQKHVKFFHRL
jgi:hypothetical protein